MKGVWGVKLGGWRTSSHDEDTKGLGECQPPPKHDNLKQESHVIRVTCHTRHMSHASHTSHASHITHVTRHTRHTSHCITSNSRVHSVVRRLSALYLRQRRRLIQKNGVVVRGGVAYTATCRILGVVEGGVRGLGVCCWGFVVVC